MPTIEDFKPFWLVPKEPKERTTCQTTFYQSRPWRKLRSHKARLNPLCELCLKEGKSVPVAEVDHIKPVNQADPYDTKNGQFGHALDITNLQSLCHRCHAKKSSKEGKFKNKDNGKANQ